jgi:hypothetical protein
MSCHIMSCYVSLHFTDHHSIKSEGAGQGQGQICLPRPSATASLSGRRQKYFGTCVNLYSILDYWYGLRRWKKVVLVEHF